MTIQLDTNARTNRLEAIRSGASGNTGASAGRIVLWAGSEPANCGTANVAGSAVWIFTLPAGAGNTMFAAASSGTMAWNNTAGAGGNWSNTTSQANTITHFRCYGNASTSNACIIQGTVTNTGGGGDMTVDNTVVNNGQTVTVTSFTLTDGNA